MLIIKYYLILKLLLYPLLIFGVQEEAKIRNQVIDIPEQLAYTQIM